MKKHDFLDLKIGAVEQYSMVVNKSDLEEWKKSGWLEFQEINLPEGDEEAFLLYGDIDENETLIFNRPTLLKNCKKKETIGLVVLELTTHLGNYGMGGAGFFGLLLSNKHYLTFAAWSAGEYVIINDRVVECNSKFYKKTKPWISNFGEDQTWDDLSDKVVGSTIKDYSFTKESCNILLLKNSKEFKIELVKNDKRLPRKVGRKKNAFKKGQISDYILFQHEEATLIV